LLRGAGRGAREEVDDEDVSRRADEVPRLSAPRRDEEPAARVEVEDAVVVVGVRGGDERKVIGRCRPDESQGDEPAEDEPALCDGHGLIVVTVTRLLAARPTPSSPSPRGTS